MIELFEKEVLALSFFRLTEDYYNHKQKNSTSFPQNEKTKPTFTKIKINICDICRTIYNVSRKKFTREALKEEYLRQLTRLPENWKMSLEKAKEHMYVERLAERLGLTPATISFHLKKLKDAKAVTSYKEQYYTMYSLCQDVFMTNILDIIKEESEVIDEQKQREDAYREKVIKTLF